MTIGTSVGLDCRYSVHEVSVRVMANSSVFAEPIELLFRYFPHKHGGVVRDELVMQIDAVSHRGEIPCAVPQDGTILFEKSGQAVGDSERTVWACRIVMHQGTLYADFHEQGLVVIHGEARRAHAYLIRPEAMHPDILESHVHFMLTELFRYQRLFVMHATALEKNGKGVLIPGYSGRGKTTSFLSLLRAGYRYLSDDHPLLTARDGRVELLSFPMKVDVTAHTVSFFPELREAPAGVLHQGPTKRYFFVEDVYDQVAIGDRCIPALVLFPHVVDEEKSWLEPLPQSRVLQELLPQGLMAYDPELSRQQFAVLSQLARQVSCYRLNFGRDVESLPGLINPLLEGMAS